MSAPKRISPHRLAAVRAWLDSAPHDDRRPMPLDMVEDLLSDRDYLDAELQRVAEAARLSQAKAEDARAEVERMRSSLSHADTSADYPYTNKWLRELAETARRERDQARAEVERLRSSLSRDEVTIADLRGLAEDAQAQRDDARAELAEATRERDEARAERDRLACQRESARVDALLGREGKAEHERAEKLLDEVKQGLPWQSMPIAAIVDALTGRDSAQAEQASGSKPTKWTDEEQAVWAGIVSRRLAANRSMSEAIEDADAYTLAIRERS